MPKNLTDDPEVMKLIAETLQSLERGIKNQELIQWKIDTEALAQLATKIMPIPKVAKATGMQSEEFAEIFTIFAVRFIEHRVGHKIHQAITELFHETWSFALPVNTLRKDTSPELKRVFSKSRIESTVHRQMMRETRKRFDEVLQGWLKGRGGSKSRADLSQLLEFYTQCLIQTKSAKDIYKFCMKSSLPDWQKVVKQKHSDMPDDLIARLSGLRTDLTNELQAKLDKKNHHDIARVSHIAAEWAARLCNIPDYYYKIKTLETALTKQRKQKQ
jgi:hypothetical protein